jgi:hypothetical protein
MENLTTGGSSGVINIFCIWACRSDSTRVFCFVLVQKWNGYEFIGGITALCRTEGTDNFFFQRFPAEQAPRLNFDRIASGLGALDLH